LERWWCSRQEAGIGTLSQRARLSYMPPEPTHIESGRAWRYGKYVCYRTERPTRGKAQRSWSAGA
jgi:hypothetical protein